MKALYLLVGMQHAFKGGEAFVCGLADGTPVRIVRDRGNPMDSNAVQVWHQGRRIGFIKGTQAPQCAAFMDRRSLEDWPAILVKGEWPRVEVEEH